MPKSASVVAAWLPNDRIARQAMPTAEAVINATWNSAASASALPCPKR